MVKNWIVDRSTARDFTIIVFTFSIFSLLFQLASTSNLMVCWKPCIFFHEWFSNFPSKYSTTIYFFDCWIMKKLTLVISSSEQHITVLSTLSQIWSLKKVIHSLLTGWLAFKLFTCPSLTKGQSAIFTHGQFLKKKCSF